MTTSTFASARQAERPPEQRPNVLAALFRADDATRISVVPVLVGLAVIWTTFTVLNPNFLSAGNLTNLAQQIIAVATISIGVVLVLLIGEIDLSAGSVSGLAASVMAVLNVQQGIPAPTAILLGLGAGALVGLIHGLIISTWGVPSFVVTLGGLIAWQGLQLLLLGDTGAINLTDPFVSGLTSVFFPIWIGWAAAIVIIGSMALNTARDRRRRRLLGLARGRLAADAVRVGAVAVVLVAALLVFGSSRGLPLSVVILGGMLALMDFVCRRTLFGRRLFTIGGDKVAAARVGVRVKTVTVLVFALASTFAAAGGILSASRLLAVNESSGAGEILLNAIAGVVIGGTSLFGGRGSVWSAILGALVIGSISNGMDLLALPSPVKYMITGGVLIAAVIFDAIMRRRKSR
ncbi:sugar ABC transporter permease [Leifsonia sp. C5G2]|uniref:sugar ABC transporter permease n=1 Tax=Leifsonia sp. C5G2 TaxID=2735269 RepID=UPI001585C1D8|nr:sugar ABC transporter permease [Leifsonia sp. C5G2]NUU05242.1 sugar ABC transporter permease [Leifsonia sp. C5G2]